MPRFTDENTAGYSEDEIERANDMYDAELAARQLDPDSATYKSECDAIAEDVLFTLDQSPTPNAA